MSDVFGAIAAMIFCTLRVCEAYMQPTSPAIVAIVESSIFGAFAAIVTCAIAAYVLMAIAAMQMFSRSLLPFLRWMHGYHKYGILFLAFVWTCPTPEAGTIASCRLTETPCMRTTTTAAELFYLRHVRSFVCRRGDGLHNDL